MKNYRAVGLIDNLSNIDNFVINEGYEASSARYMEALGGNNGNIAFVDGTRKCISNKIIRMNWGWSGERARELVDVIVISCANQIGRHADLSGWADAIIRFDLPVVLIGLGAQTTNYEDEIDIPDGTIRFLEEVVKRRPVRDVSNIAVRGDYTKGVLADIGFDSEAIGCPSLYISPVKDLGRQIEIQSRGVEFKRVAVAAGNPFHVENRKVESLMIEICNKFDGAYVVQHPESLVSLALCNDYVGDEKIATIGSALGFETVDMCKKWFRRNSYSFHEPKTWMHFLRHYDVAIGARYHGIALAVQAGIPGLVLHIDNRTRELSEATGIPSIGIAEIMRAPERILEAARWDCATANSFDVNRRQRADWMARFIRQNGLTPSDQLTYLAQA